MLKSTDITKLDIQLLCDHDSVAFVVRIHAKVSVAFLEADIILVSLRLTDYGGGKSLSSGI